MILLPRSDFVGTWSSPRVSHRRVIWPNPETLWWLWWVTESFGVFSRSRYLLLRSFLHIPSEKALVPSEDGSRQDLHGSQNRGESWKVSGTESSRREGVWLWGWFEQHNMGINHVQEEKKKSKRRKEKKFFKKTKESNQQVFYPLAPRPW